MKDELKSKKKCQIDPNIEGSSPKKGVSSDIDHSKNKIKAKACKKFSIALISQAVRNDWEENELARLVLLIAEERQLNAQKTLQFLQSCNIISPVLLSFLADENFQWTSSQMISAMYDQAQHIDRYIEVIGEAFEQRLLVLKDEDTLDAVSTDK
jgi:hypothetical protein